MKRLLFILIILSSGTLFGHNRYRNGVNFQYFYNSLSPYGEWISIDAGVYAWRPFNVQSDWRPYSQGRWSWTEYGWYWESYENFGWATYHYGRWYFDEYNGWLWIPDYTWGPSWVEWRYDNDYIGWSPLPPYADLRINVGIHFSFGWRSHYTHWNFVRYRHFCSSNINTYYVGGYKGKRIFNRSKYRTNYYYDGNRVINRGVDRNYVERRSGIRINKRKVSFTKSRVHNRNKNLNRKNLNAFRPNVVRNSRSEREFINKLNGRTIKTKRTSLRTNKIYSNKRSSNDIITRNSKIKKQQKNNKRELTKDRTKRIRKRNDNEGKLTTKKGSIRGRSIKKNSRLLKNSIENKKTKVSNKRNVNRVSMKKNITRKKVDMSSKPAKRKDSKRKSYKRSR